MTDSVEPTPADEPAATPMPAMEITPEVKALLDQMAALQARVDAMESERPAPPNLVSAALRDLTDHLNARAAQYPGQLDMTEVWDSVKTLAEDAATHPSEVASLVKETVHELADMHPGKELAYLRELATKFVKLNLKALAGI